MKYDCRILRVDELPSNDVELTIEIVINKNRFTTSTGKFHTNRKGNGTYPKRPFESHRKFIMGFLELTSMLVVSVV